jgi:hypothetical protein
MKTCWFCSSVSAHRVNVGSTANVSEVEAASIFRVEVSSVREWLRMYRFLVRNRSIQKGGWGEVMVPSPGWQWTGKSYVMANFGTAKCTKNPFASGIPIHCINISNQPTWRLKSVKTSTVLGEWRLWRCKFRGNGSWPQKMMGLGINMLSLWVLPEDGLK